MDKRDHVLGIDLGTTYSVLAVIQDGRPQVIPVKGQKLLASVVGIGPGGELLVGAPARNQWVVSPERTVRSIKRMMGQSETVTMAGKSYMPQEISAFTLREIREAAEAALGYPVKRAVITVPAYFNEVQRQATIQAGEIAGLEVERIINEPTASALVYGYGLQSDQHLRVLVYDLGGGTFDVSLIELDHGVVDVLATSGENSLGGDDFDERLAGRLADEFVHEHHIDLRADHQAWARLLRAAEEAKIELSSAPYALVSLEYVAKDKRGTPLHLRREVTRLEFIDLIDDLLTRTIACVDRALVDAHLEPEDVDRVLLVGGSTRIPAVWDLVAARLKQDPHIEIDPDLAVALGAAVQGGIIAGAQIDTILVDVTPYSLGIEVVEFGFTGRLHDDRFAPLVRRNTTLPVEKSQLFNTLFPGQKAIQVKVYQGESRFASQNVLLGDFLIEDLEPNRADGLTEVTVNFALDINGILEVTAIERKTGKRVSQQLKASRQRLSPEEIAQSQAKLAEAARGGEGDQAAAVEQIVDAGTAALLAQADAVLSQPGLDADRAARIAGAAADVRRAAGEGDDERVEEHSDRLIDLLLEAEE